MRQAGEDAEPSTVSEEQHRTQNWATDSWEPGSWGHNEQYQNPMMSPRARLAGKDLCLEAQWPWQGEGGKGVSSVCVASWASLCDPPKSAVRDRRDRVSVTCVSNARPSAGSQEALGALAGTMRLALPLSGE